MLGDVSNSPQLPNNSRTVGITLAVASYALWGFLPLYFLLLAPSSALEIVAWRVVLSLVFCALIVVVTGQLRALMTIVADRRTVLTLAIAGVLILINWLVYVFAALSGHVVEAALGYFINPIVTVLLGVLVLGEKLRLVQWVAIGFSAVAVLVLAVSYGQFPWIALALAFSFGTYGLLKKKVADRVDAVSGLTIETAFLAPLAIVLLVVMSLTGSLTIGAFGAGHMIALLLAGVVTAVPLLMFAAAARRIPLTFIGLTQYMSPIAQFLIGVFVLSEAMPPARWFGFGLVWIALIILTVDIVIRSNRSRKDLG
jgi:chloramphenicol-sensitive protein RarD